MQTIIVRAIFNLLLFSLLIHGLYISNTENHTFDGIEFVPPFITILVFLIQVHVIYIKSAGGTCSSRTAKIIACVYSFLSGIVCGVMVYRAYMLNSGEGVAYATGMVLQWGVFGWVMGWLYLKIAHVFGWRK